MTDRLNRRLETIKNLLVCAALVSVIATSCRRERSSAELVAEILNLRAVMCAAPDLRVDNETPPAADERRTAEERAPF